MCADCARDTGNRYRRAANMTRQKSATRVAYAFGGGGSGGKLGPRALCAALEKTRPVASGLGERVSRTGTVKRAVQL
jgi:hypothetical protein